MPKARLINGFHFSNKFISVVQYQPDDNAVVSIVIKPLQEGAGDWWQGLEADFKSIITDLKFTNRNVICALPSERVVVKRILLDHDEPDVGAALYWEFSQQVVGSIDEYVLDFKENEDRVLPDGSKEYLVVACRSEALKKLTAMMRASKLNPVVCDVD
ncbi:MAG: pilus assembly protein PilM, partial [Chitinivibrionales bacterium]|nr:pilus assembly protein PilM [Chitinivibrionales bacterium]